MIQVQERRNRGALRARRAFISVSLFPPPSPEPSTPLLLFPSDKANRSTFTLPQREAGRWEVVVMVVGWGGGAAEREKRKNPQEQGTAWIGGKVGDKRATVTEMGGGGPKSDSFKTEQNL